LRSLNQHSRLCFDFFPSCAYFPPFHLSRVWIAETVQLPFLNFPWPIFFENFSCFAFFSPQGMSTGQLLHESLIFFHLVPPLFLFLSVSTFFFFSVKLKKTAKCDAPFVQLPPQFAFPPRFLWRHTVDGLFEISPCSFPQKTIFFFFLVEGRNTHKAAMKFKRVIAPPLFSSLHPPPLPRPPPFFVVGHFPPRTTSICVMSALSPSGHTRCLQNASGRRRTVWSILLSSTHASWHS